MDVRYEKIEGRDSAVSSENEVCVGPPGGASVHGISFWRGATLPVQKERSHLQIQSKRGKKLCGIRLRKDYLKTARH